MGFDCRFDKAEIIKRLQDILNKLGTLDQDILNKLGVIDQDILNKLGVIEQKIPSIDVEQKLLASIFNTSVTANTNILSQSIAPTRSPVLFRIYASFDTAGILSVVRTKGTVTVVEQLNSGNNLNANCAYIFDIVVESGETINLRYSVNATCLVLKVVETKW
jgi:hypothetical protein